MEDCQQLLSIRQENVPQKTSPAVFAPMVNETVDVSVDADTWDIKVGSNLFKKLHFATVQGRNIATVTGELLAESQHPSTELLERTKKLKMMEAGSQASSPEAKHGDISAKAGPVLDIVSSSSARSALSTDRPIHVGDVVLRELQKHMTDDGHKARFVGGGTLLIDDTVAVRKLGTGKIVVEGTSNNRIKVATRSSLLDGFAQVKRKIYQGLPIVAAG